MFIFKKKNLSSRRRFNIIAGVIHAFDAPKSVPVIIIDTAYGALFSICVYAANAVHRTRTYTFYYYSKLKNFAHPYTEYFFVLFSERCQGFFFKHSFQLLMYLK